MKKLVSIVIPVYNNSLTLKLLYDRIITDLISIKQEYDYEIIFVNDGSKDNSLEILLSLSSEDSRVAVINLSKNFGQIYAILAGWRYAKGDVSIDFSADLQDPPSQCVNMLSEWEKGNKIVVSYRQRNNSTFTRIITSKLFYTLILPTAPQGGFDFTLLDRQALDLLVSFKDKNKFYQADILSLGLPFRAIPYIKKARTLGKSQYSGLKRAKFFLAMYINISYLPIKFISIFGFIVTIFSCMYSVFVLINYFFFATPFKGWTPIVLLILFFGGMILLTLGVIGQYIWRILDEVRSRPNYIIESITRR